VRSQWRVPETTPHELGEERQRRDRHGEPPRRGSPIEEMEREVGEQEPESDRQDRLQW
jgi:hypothetical protein